MPTGLDWLFGPVNAPGPGNAVPSMINASAQRFSALEASRRAAAGNRATAEQNQLAREHAAAESQKKIDAEAAAAAKQAEFLLEQKRLELQKQQAAKRAELIKSKEFQQAIRSKDAAALDRFQPALGSVGLEVMPVAPDPGELPPPPEPPEPPPERGPQSQGATGIPLEQRGQAHIAAQAEYAAKLKEWSDAKAQWEAQKVASGKLQIVDPATGGVIGEFDPKANEAKAQERADSWAKAWEENFVGHVRGGDAARAAVAAQIGRTAILSQDKSEEEATKMATQFYERIRGQDLSYQAALARGDRSDDTGSRSEEKLETQQYDAAVGFISGDSKARGAIGLTQAKDAYFRAQGAIAQFDRALGDKEGKAAAGMIGRANLIKELFGRGSDYDAKQVNELGGFVTELEQRWNKVAKEGKTSETLIRELRAEAIKMMELAATKIKATEDEAKRYLRTRPMRPDVRDRVAEHFDLDIADEGSGQPTGQSPPVAPGGDSSSDAPDPREDPEAYRAWLKKRMGR